MPENLKPQNENFVDHVDDHDSESDKFYEESLETAKGIIDQASEKLTSSQSKELQTVQANVIFAQKVLNVDDYSDLQDFCDSLNVSQIRYINQQLAENSNRTSFLKKLVDISKNEKLAQELKNKPLSKFKEQVSTLKQGSHKSASNSYTN